MPEPAGSGGQRAGTLALLEALRLAAEGASAATRRPSGPIGAAADAEDEEQLLLDSQARHGARTSEPCTRAVYRCSQ